MLGHDFLPVQVGRPGQPLLVRCTCGFGSDGVTKLEWQRHVRGALSSQAAKLSEVVERVEVPEPHLRRRRRRDEAGS